LKLVSLKEIYWLRLHIERVVKFFNLKRIKKMYIFYDWLLSLDFGAWLLSVDFCSGVISVVFYANGGDLEKVIKKENRAKSGIYR